MPCLEPKANTYIQCLPNNTQRILEQTLLHVSNEHNHSCNEACSYIYTCVISDTNISPQNMLTAFWPIACLQPPTSNPVSSKVAIVLEDDLAAFHRVDPQVSSCYIHMHTHVYNYVKIEFNHYHDYKLYFA